jgi:hypothetical protein
MGTPGQPRRRDLGGPARPPLLIFSRPRRSRVYLVACGLPLSERAVRARTGMRRRAGGQTGRAARTGMHRVRDGRTAQTSGTGMPRGSGGWTGRADSAGILAAAGLPRRVGGRTGQTLGTFVPMWTGLTGPVPVGRMLGRRGGRTGGGDLRSDWHPRGRRHVSAAPRSTLPDRRDPRARSRRAPRATKGAPAPRFGRPVAWRSRSVRLDRRLWARPA